jgi:hypothetical protein
LSGRPFYTSLELEKISELAKTLESRSKRKRRERERERERERGEEAYLAHICSRIRHGYAWARLWGAGAGAKS